MPTRRRRSGDLRVRRAAAAPAGLCRAGAPLRVPRDADARPASTARPSPISRSNTEVLGWLIRRVERQPLVEQVLSERVWPPLGMEQDAYLQVDGGGAPMCSRRPQPDAARPGALLRHDAPGRSLQRPPGRAARGGRRHPRAGRPATISRKPATRRCPAGAITTSGGSRTTTTAPTWRAASTARRATSIPGPRCRSSASPRTRSRPTRISIRRRCPRTARSPTT